MTTPDPFDTGEYPDREPTALWILGLVAALTVVWLAVLAWMWQVLPDRVPTHFGVGGAPDGWSSRTGALTMMVLLPLLTVYPLPLLARLARKYPGSINVPNRQWWIASPVRLVRFERLLREDLWLIAILVLGLYIATSVGIVEAARASDHAMPAAYFAVPLILFIAGMVAVLVRMAGSSRYAEDPDLA